MSPSQPHSASRRRAALDPEILGQLRRLGEKLGEDVLGDVIASYLRDSRELLAAIDRALTEADAKALAKAAHSLVGISAAIGADDLVSICRALEERVYAGGLEGCREAVAAVVAEHRRVVAALSEVAAQTAAFSSGASPSRKA